MKKLSDKEFEILKLIWEHNGELNSTQLYDLINKKVNSQWKRKTISVFITRMISKGVLSYRKVGRISYYKAISKTEYQQFLIDSQVHSFTGKSFKELLITFIGRENDEEALKEVDLFLEKYKQ